MRGSTRPTIDDAIRECVVRLDVARVFLPISASARARFAAIEAEIRELRRRRDRGERYLEART